MAASVAACFNWSSLARDSRSNRSACAADPSVETVTVDRYQMMPELENLPDVGLIRILHFDHQEFLVHAAQPVLPSRQFGAPYPSQCFLVLGVHLRVEHGGRSRQGSPGGMLESTGPPVQRSSP